MKLFSSYKFKLLGLLVICVSLACLGVSTIAITAMKKNSLEIFQNQGRKKESLPRLPTKIKDLFRL